MLSSCFSARGRGAAIFQYEFATLEWLWDQNGIRLNLPGGQEQHFTGTYDEIVALLNDLGRHGWDVATCTSGGNWLFWTLRRHLGA